MWTLVVFSSLLVLVAESAVRTPVTRLDQEHFMRPNEILAIHMRNVLERMSALKVTVHPRIRHLYELLKKDMEYGRRHRAHEQLNLSPVRRPGYDINKLNRIYTTPQS